MSILRGDYVSKDSATYTAPDIHQTIRYLSHPMAGVVNVHCGMPFVVNVLLFKWCGEYCNLLYGVLNVLFCIGYGQCLVW